MCRVNSDTMCSVVVTLLCASHRLDIHNIMIVIHLRVIARVYSIKRVDVVHESTVLRFVW